MEAHLQVGNSAENLGDSGVTLAIFLVLEMLDSRLGQLRVAPFRRPYALEISASMFGGFYLCQHWNATRTGAF
jgi:hypothetical protein